MRAFVVAALRSRLSALGIALTTASALIFLGLILLEVLGALKNPYIGIVIFVVMPVLFVLGLLLIPIGLWLDAAPGCRALPSAWPTFDFRNTTHRRMLVFVLVATIVNLTIIAMASVGAVEYTESQTFCGQVCHTPMEPEFTAHQSGPHARVHCVSCHVGPGPGGFLTAKMNGTRQLWHVITGGYSRPIPTPIHNLPEVVGTCEQCHAPDRYVGDVVKVVLRARRRRGQYADQDRGDAQGRRGVCRQRHGRGHPLAHEPRQRRRVHRPRRQPREDSLRARDDARRESP